MSPSLISGELCVRADAAAGRALDFLQARQLPHGEFVTLLGLNRSMAGAVPDSTGFVTAQLIYSLTFANDARARRMIRSAAGFLRGEQEPGGLWRYWSSSSYRHARLGPDLDDTACSSVALRRAGYPAPRNLWAFRRMRDEQGRFFTWVSPTRLRRYDLLGRALLAAGARRADRQAARTPAPPSEDPRFITMRINPDDVDPVVNANVLLWLGERPETRAAMQFVCETVLADPPAVSLYYEDMLVLHYAVARASAEAAPTLRGLGPHIVARIQARLDAGEAFDPLKAALAATALAVFAPQAPALAQLLAHILGAQQADGSWIACPFYNVWGSPELTTGFCLEALARIGARTAA